MFVLVPSRAGAWGSCGLAGRSWAGLQNSRGGAPGQSAASRVSPLRSLDISEPVPPYAKREMQGALTRVLPKDTLCPCASRMTGETALEAENAVFLSQIEPVLFTQTIVDFYICFYTSLSGTPGYE